MRGRLQREISELNPGYGAWVMATAIVSTGLHLFGHRTLSTVLLVIACAAFALLLVAYTWRFIGYRPQALADARNPSRAFGYFSLVAATNVLAVRVAPGCTRRPARATGRRTGWDSWSTSPEVRCGWASSPGWSSSSR